MQVFRQNCYQQYPPMMTTYPGTTSRGRSLTPPSYKQGLHLRPIHHPHSQDLYYHHPYVYSDSAYHRTYRNQYLMQRLPPSVPVPLVLSSSLLWSRAYRKIYSLSGVNHYAVNLSSSSRCRQNHNRHGYDWKKKRSRLHQIDRCYSSFRFLSS